MWNYGEIFGAINLAMFVPISVTFLGATLKTGAINAGNAWVVGITGIASGFAGATINEGWIDHRPRWVCT